MLKLHNLVSVTKKRKRIGRGGSRGGTSTKGHKGQKARSGGYVRRGYEGGQTPLIRRIPKRGFNNIDFKKDVYIVTLRQLNDGFEAGDFVDKTTLIDKGILKIKKGSQNSSAVIKILATGVLTKKLVIIADACSISAQKMVQDLGGEVRLTKES
jgi:large subunit ribosomal protein L15